MAQDEYYSVTFKVIDKEKFRELMIKFSGSLNEQTELNGAVVTACGDGDVFTEKDALEHFLMEEGYPNSEDIINEFQRDAEEGC